MLDAGQLRDIAAAGGDDQTIVPDIAGIGLDHPAAVTNTACHTLVKPHPLATEKVLQVDRDVIATA